MSNLEHLIENGLSALKRGVGYEKWLKTIKDDVNWQGNENISIEQLWTICQYVIYTWIPSAEPKRGKWINDTYCSECGWINIVDSGFIGSVNHYNFCPNCGKKMKGEQI